MVSANQGVILSVIDKPRLVIEKGSRRSIDWGEMVFAHPTEHAGDGASRPENFFLPIDQANTVWSSLYLMISS